MNKFENFKRKQKAFALAEIMVALICVTLAILLVGGLSQQVINMGKRSTQTGAILEVRSMVNAITRNPASWINQMRSSTQAQGIFAGCIPDPKLNISTYNCPVTDENITKDDKELAEIAGSQFYVASTPVLNSSGELVAGTLDNPLYLNSSGRKCDNGNAADCVFKSTGYFLRSNSQTDASPGAVKFVIKLERNTLITAGKQSPMKTQYMSVDVGEDWKSLNTTSTVLSNGSTSSSADTNCPNGTIKVGYLSTGAPSCVNPLQPCTTGNEFPIGVDSTGKTICKKLPVCADTSQSVVLNSSGTDLVCSTSQSPCGTNNIFLGYFGGTGKPMCSGGEIKCEVNQLQVGINIVEGQMKAECTTLPSSTCTDTNSKLTFDGTKFVCQSAAVAISCPANQVMSGIKTDGSPNCIDRSPASVATTCPAGQVVTGIDQNSQVQCRAITSADLKVIGQCPAGSFLSGLDSNGNKICLQSVTQNIVDLSVITAVLGGPLPPAWDGTCKSIIYNAAVGFYYNTGCKRWCTNQGFGGGSMVECAATTSVCQCNR